MPSQIGALADYEGHNDQAINEIGVQESRDLNLVQHGEGTIIPFAIGVSLVIGASFYKIKGVFDCLNDTPAEKSDSVAKTAQAALLGLHLLTNPTPAEAEVTQDEVMQLCEDQAARIIEQIDTVIPDSYSPNLDLQEFVVTNEEIPQVHRLTYDRIYTANDLPRSTDFRDFLDSSLFKFSAGFVAIMALYGAVAVASTTKIEPTKEEEEVLTTAEIRYELERYNRKRLAKK